MEGKFDLFLATYKMNCEKIEKLVEDTKKSINDLSISVTKLDTKVTGLDTKIQNVDLKFSAKNQEYDKKIGEMVTSYNFLNAKYEGLKGLENRLTTLQKENSLQQQSIDNLQNELKNETANRNAESQYMRSVFHLKLHGLPLQKGEENFIMRDNTKVPTNSSRNEKTHNIIKYVIELAHFDFDVGSIDVCHRTSSYYFSPIIIRFSNKHQRERFFNQRHKLRSLDVMDLDLDYDDEKVAQWRNERAAQNKSKDWSGEFPYINVHEHLTAMNSELLKETQKAGRAKGYKYPGYFSKGTVQERMSDTTRAVIIRTHADLGNIR